MERKDKEANIIFMKKDLFEELLESVKQGGSIMRGAMKPSRSFEFPESEVRKIREHYGLSQDKFASLMGISVAFAIGSRGDVSPRE